MTTQPFHAHESDGRLRPEGGERGENIDESVTKVQRMYRSGPSSATAVEKEKKRPGSPIPRTRPSPFGWTSGGQSWRLTAFEGCCIGNALSEPSKKTKRENLAQEDIDNELDEGHDALSSRRRGRRGGTRELIATVTATSGSTRHTCRVSRDSDGATDANTETRVPREKVRHCSGMDLKVGCVFESQGGDEEEVQQVDKPRFLQSALSNVQSSQLWFALLAQLANEKEAVPVEQYNWAVKLAIGLLHISKEAGNGTLRFKSLAIIELSSILDEVELSTKQARLHHFINSFKTIMNDASYVLPCSDTAMNMTGTERTNRESDVLFRMSDSTAALKTDQMTHLGISPSVNKEIEGNAPCPDTEHDTIEIATEKEMRDKGGHFQENETDASSLPLPSISGLAMHAESHLSARHSNSGDLESPALTTAPKQSHCMPWSLSMPFNRASPTSNVVHPTNRMNCSPRLGGLEMRGSGSSARTVFENMTSLDLQSSLLQTQKPCTGSSAGVLPIPELPLNFPNKLTPPKLPGRNSSTRMQQQTPASIPQGWTVASVTGAFSGGIHLPPTRKQQLLSSQSLSPSSTLKSMNEQDVEEIVKTTAARPLSIDIPEKMAHSTRGQRDGKRDFPTASDLNTVKSLIRNGIPRRMKHSVQHRPAKSSSLPRIVRRENTRLIKCLLTNDGHPRRTLCHVSGYVDNDIWTRLPATIIVTQFQDKTRFEQQSHQMTKLALSLDEDAPRSHAVPRLFEQNLVAVASLPGFQMIILPTHAEPHMYNIEVFVAPTSIAECPLSA